jgi:hypothetical protein
LANILELNVESVELFFFFSFQNLATIKPEKPSFFHHFEKFQSKGENLPKTKTLPLYLHWAMTCTFVSSPSVVKGAK